MSASVPSKASSRGPSGRRARVRTYIHEPRPPVQIRCDSGSASTMMKAIMAWIAWTIQGGRRKKRRVVVSGPAGYNKAVKRMLDQCGVEAAAVTILEA